MKLIQTKFLEPNLFLLGVCHDTRFPQSAHFMIGFDSLHHSLADLSIHCLAWLCCPSLRCCTSYVSSSSSSASSGPNVGVSPYWAPLRPAPPPHLPRGLNLGHFQASAWSLKFRCWRRCACSDRGGELTKSGLHWKAVSSQVFFPKF